MHTFPRNGRNRSVAQASACVRPAQPRIVFPTTYRPPPTTHPPASAKIVLTAPPCSHILGGTSRVNPATLALAGGAVFGGSRVGAHTDEAGEVLFNTAITGYQAIFTGPSSPGEIVVL